jgi:hypothetical protein
VTWSRTVPLTTPANRQFPRFAPSGSGETIKRRSQPNQSFQYKGRYRGLTLDHSSDSRRLVAPGNGVVLYDGRIPAHPAGARDRRGFDSSDSGPSSCLIGSCGIYGGDGQLFGCPLLLVKGINWPCERRPPSSAFSICGFVFGRCAQS